MKSPTKKYKACAWIFTILSLLLTFGPIIVYGGMAFAQAETKNQIILGVAFVIALILTIINLLFKYHIRSGLWMILLGIYICLDKITVLLIIMAITTILDEFVFTPLSKHYRNKYKINKEIDKRIP